MIDGFRLKISSEELRQHCKDRANYHKKRADDRRSQLPKLKEATSALKDSLEGAENVAQMNKTSTYVRDPEDVIADLENSIREHENKVLVFNYFSEHLFSEDYNLAEADLVRLEILKR